MRHSIQKLISRMIFSITLGLPILSFGQKDKVEKISYLRPAYWRAYDQSGINVFETTKQEDIVPFDALRIRFGAGFTYL